MSAWALCCLSVCPLGLSSGFPALFRLLRMDRGAHPGTPGSQLPWMSLFPLSLPPCLPHCRSNLPDSVLKQPADILVKTNLILFLFWDRWKEIDAFVSNKKERERDNTPLFFLTAIFLEQKLEAVTPARTEPASREAGARLAGTGPSIDKTQSFTQWEVPKSPEPWDLRTWDAV